MEVLCNFRRSKVVPWDAHGARETFEDDIVYYMHVLYDLYTYMYIYILYMFIGNDISNYEVQCIFEHVSVLCFDNNSVVQ